MESDEVDLVALAVFGGFEQVEDAEEAGGASQLGSDVGEAEGLDGVDFDFAGPHGVAGADADVGAGPDADAGGDFATANAVAKTLVEDHGVSLLEAGRSGDAHPPTLGAVTLRQGWGTHSVLG